MGLFFFALLPYESVIPSNYQLYTLSNSIDSTKPDNVYVALDNNDYDNLPKRFRKSSYINSIIHNINTIGLNTLNISGSQQFSEVNLPLLLKAIETDLPIINFDLRQESHGFINGLPISFQNELNNANKGLNYTQVLQNKNDSINSIKLGIPLTIKNETDMTIIPKEVFDENTLVTSNKLKYTRILATDRVLPTPSTIDTFIDVINKIDEESWLHFHCKEGIGRTTAFMIFYDMMKNYKDVSAKDIIERQIALANFDEESIRFLTSEERMDLYNSFYNYCKDNKGNFNIKYSDYRNQHN